MNLRDVLSSFINDPNQLAAAIQAMSAAGFPQSASDVSNSLPHATSTSDVVDVDLQRAQRCGFPEVVFGEGKTLEMILAVLTAQQNVGQSSLVTRISAAHSERVIEQFPDAVHNSLARTLRIQRRSQSYTTSIREQCPQQKAGPVFVVSAGSSDRPVAEEAVETLRWMDVECDLIMDIGVAGPHRLLRHVDRLKTAVAIVCVAGMEAALPSVLGGHVACPVIGVPTSVGYGASLGGLTAMFAMLTCCASNVVCVNIDAGFKGGYVAGLIATRQLAAKP